MSNESPIIKFGITTDGMRLSYWRLRAGMKRPELFLEREAYGKSWHFSMHASSRWHMKESRNERVTWTKPNEVVSGYTRRSASCSRWRWLTGRTRRPMRSCSFRSRPMRSPRRSAYSSSGPAPISKAVPDHLAVVVLAGLSLGAMAWPTASTPPPHVWERMAAGEEYSTWETSAVTTPAEFTDLARSGKGLRPEWQVRTVTGVETKHAKAPGTGQADVFELTRSVTVAMSCPPQRGWCGLLLIGSVGVPSMRVG